GDVGATLRWNSNLDGPIGTGPAFSTSRLSAGTHTVTATANDTGGLLGRVQATIVIRPPDAAPSVTIISPGDGAALLVGKPVVLGATALDAEDGDLSPTIRWTSSRDGVLGTGPTVLRPSLSAGTHTLTATVTALDGPTGSASITVHVVPATLAFSPVADTYVDSGAATKVLGTATTIQAASSPVRQAFLRFQVNGVAPLKVQQALVRLTVGSSSTDASAVGGTLRTITNGTWSEATTTYNTRPGTEPHPQHRLAWDLQREGDRRRERRPLGPDPVDVQPRRRPRHGGEHHRGAPPARHAHDHGPRDGRDRPERPGADHAPGRPQAERGHRHAAEPQRLLRRPGARRPDGHRQRLRGRQPERPAPVELRPRRVARRGREH